MATYAASITTIQTQVNALVTALTSGHSVTTGEVTALAALKTNVDALVPKMAALGAEAGEIQGYAIRGNQAIAI